MKPLANICMKQIKNISKKYNLVKIHIIFKNCFWSILNLPSSSYF